MAYQENIPLATDLKYQSQADIQGNFQAIKTLVDVDHITFGDADEGKHSQVTLPVDTLPVTGAAEVALFCKNNAAGAAALWFVPESAGTEVDFTTAALATSGYAKLPSGLMIKWGTGTVGTNTTGVGTYNATTAFTSVFSASVTLNGQAGMDKALFLQTLGTTSVTVYNANGNGGTRTFYYYVIGI